MLICPICGEPLTYEAPPHPASARSVCANRHSFDVARQGYVNLLARPTRLQADTGEMLRARRAFLARGHYAPLSDAVNELVAAGIASTQGAVPTLPRAALDVGCGEGYYIGRLAASLAHMGGWRCFGLDLARDAARMAATAYPQATFVVGNIRDQLPFAAASLGALLNVFAPRSPVEFARVVAPGAALVVVIPAAEHLFEAREALGLLTIEQEKEAHVTEQFADAFTLAEARGLAYDLALPQADLRELMTMTPNARHVERRAIATLPDSMQVRAAFRLLRFTRHQS